MRNDEVERGWLLTFLVNSYSLSSVGQAGSEPVEQCTRNSVEVLKSLRESGVISGVKRS